MKIDKDYKIRVTPEQSEEIQEICFKQGFRWYDSADYVANTNVPFIFIDLLVKDLTHTNDESYFLKEYHTEISAKEFIEKFGLGLVENDNSELVEEIIGVQSKPINYKTYAKLLEYLYLHEVVDEFEEREALIDFLKKTL